MGYPHFLIFPFSMEPNAIATVMPVEGRVGGMNLEMADSN
jgi:hypothetical protein